VTGTGLPENTDALEMAEAVLKADIKSEKAVEMKEQAMFLKAQALMALNQLEASRKVLEEIKAQKPNDPEPIRSLAIWAMRTLPRFSSVGSESWLSSDWTMRITPSTSAGPTALPSSSMS